ncbi:endonuclease/exonuclease/phosphatase family protein [Mycolicibacterium holsaticum]|uniref:endonuclease/exonuclease/phosphatase family protein n=1 Tax=Mycolicibacterium holsaticum TaxID=152142 RepID=UPI001F45E5C6|nr:endonuclease/exonuclease/phosphatase family protein [Mycolicibacterium holsaticum]
MLAAAALVLSLSTVVVRAHPISNVIELIAAVGSPYTPWMALAGVTLLALCRRIFATIAALAVLAATLVIQVPWYYFARTADVGAHADVNVLSSNLWKGRADESSFVGLAKDSADVITVSELTPEAVARFSQAGIEEAFPYSVLNPAPNAGGIGLWSRFPLTAVRTPKHRDTTIIAARVQILGARFDPLIASVHITSPVTAEPGSFDAWQRGIAATRADLDAFAKSAGSAAVIVGGDFNSTPDMRQFRDLLTNGYRDAVDQTGAGFAPTFPSNKWFPPALVIDHVLIRNAAASSVRAKNIPGSDHRALLATIRVPIDPAPPSSATLITN